MQVFAHIGMLTRYLRVPIFIQILNVLDLHLNGKKFESSTLGSSKGILSQTVTDRTNITIANTESRMWPSRLVYLHLTLAYSKGHGQGYAHFDC